MSRLVGPNGQPIGQYLDGKNPSFTNKKADPPKTGPSFGQWSGPDIQYGMLPGGGVVQFDLSKLAVEDFRGMRDHYQVNASLAVLSFMQHQADWHIECDDKTIGAEVERQLREVWTPLNRSLGTANWAGYAPAALEWYNNGVTGKIEINKIKDLIPEDNVVNWKSVEGWAPPGKIGPKFSVYDGIRQWGQPYPIPVDNSLWYPLLMENGDYYGRKLLRPAFQSWYFSILLHLFANRYYERFGEPTPVGRAPYDDSINVAGTDVNGADFLLGVLQKLRSRSAVVLPNDRTQDGTTGKASFDYEIEYLESQMRGADFERYMTRLDEEISIGLFTPILLLRTADVGSYNLGVGHMQVYLWMLNAMNDDRKIYIDKYIINRIVDFNYSPKAPRAQIKFRKMGNTDTDLIKQVVVELIKSNKAAVNLEEIGQMTGMTLKQVRQTLAKQPAAPAVNPADPNAPATGTGDPGGGNGTSPAKQSNVLTAGVWAVVTEIKGRVRGQVEAAFKEHRFGDGFAPSLGFKRRMESALRDSERFAPLVATDRLYGRLDAWCLDAVALGEDEFSGADSFMAIFERVLDIEIEEMLA